MIKTLLWDIDGTLLNFEKSENYAIKKCFEIFEQIIDNSVQTVIPCMHMYI